MATTLWGLDVIWLMICKVNGKTIVFIPVVGFFVSGLGAY